MYLKTPSNNRIRNYFKKTFKRLERDLIVCSINWDFLCIIALFLVSFEIKKSWKNKKRIIQRSKKKGKKDGTKEIVKRRWLFKQPKESFHIDGMESIRRPWLQSMSVVVHSSLVLHVHNKFLHHFRLRADHGLQFRQHQRARRFLEDYRFRTDIRQVKKKWRLF